MFQVTTLLSEAEKLEKELMKNPPPSEADREAAKLFVKEKGEGVAKLKSKKASKEVISDSFAVLKKAKQNLAKLEERSKLKRGIPQKGWKDGLCKRFLCSSSIVLLFLAILQVETHAMCC